MTVINKLPSTQDITKMRHVSESLESAAKCFFDDLVDSDESALNICHEVHCPAWILLKWRDKRTVVNVE